MELHTRRLRLQPLSLRDRDDIYALSRLPEVMRYTSMPALSLEESDAFLARYLDGMRAGSIASWTVHVHGSGFAGQASVFGIDTRNHCGEVGYVLMPQAWGKGYGSEVVAALVRYGFDYRRLARLNAEIDPANGASARVLEKHGFVREGFRRATLYKENRFHDACLYGIVNERRIAELSAVE